MSAVEAVLQNEARGRGRALTADAIAAVERALARGAEAHWDPTHYGARAALYVERVDAAAHAELTAAGFSWIEHVRTAVAWLAQ